MRSPPISKGKLRRFPIARLIDKNRPITQQLTDIFGRSTVRKSEVLKGENIARPQWRTEVIGEQFCDDLIKYLAPTLEQYKGTTIIDINPGVCIFSSKLHDFLQPKCHLLMEPEQRYYEPFIKPLLEKPGSKYTHTTLRGAHARSYWTNYTKVLDDPKLLPPRPHLPRDDPRLRQIDTSMLVIGNLWREDHTRRSVSYKMVDMAPLVLQHMLWGALSNEIFHRAGLVRMLWWAPEHRIFDTLTASTWKRRHYQMSMSFGAELVQVAGTKSIERVIEEQSPLYSRPAGLQQVALVRNDTNTATQPVLTPHLDISSSSPNTKSWEGPNPLDTTCSTFDELYQLIDDFEKKALPLIDVPYVKSGPGSSKKFLAEREVKPGSASPEPASQSPYVYPQAEAAVEGSITAHRFNTSNKFARAATAIDVSLQLIHIEAELAALSEASKDRSEVEKATKLVLQLSQTLDKIANTRLSMVVLEIMNICTEHILAAYATPRPVSRDRRPFEPLQATSADFWPPQDLVLFMMTPATHTLAIPGELSNKDATDISREMIKSLMISHSAPLPIALDRIVPNAAKDLIPLVPAITDARRGGRLDPMKVLPRTLPQEAILDLCKAYLEWPFRPSKIELMLETEELEEVDEGVTGIGLEDDA